MGTDVDAWNGLLSSTSAVSVATAVTVGRRREPLGSSRAERVRISPRARPHQSEPDSTSARGVCRRTEGRDRRGSSYPDAWWPQAALPFHTFLVGQSASLESTGTMPNGPMAMWFAGEFLEVVEPGRLVYTEVLADEHGVPLDGSEVPGGNEVTKVRVGLVAADGGTCMVVTHVGIPAGSPGDAGWAMAIDQLDQVLAS